MTGSDEAPVVMDEQGLRITADELTTPGARYALDQVEAVEHRIRTPVLGPLLLAVVGVANVVVAVQTRATVDFAISGAMIGAALWWWLHSLRHVLTVTVGGERVDAWAVRRSAPVQRAVERLETLLAARRSAP